LARARILELSSARKRALEADQHDHQSGGRGDGGKSQHVDEVLVDVERALEEFSRETGKIPTFLTEASVFRRQYFRQRFLPKLYAYSGNQQAAKSALLARMTEKKMCKKM